MKKTIVTERGVEYEVTGNYPNPPYTKQMKNKGEVEAVLEKEINVNTLSEPEFKRLVLKALNLPVKED